MSHLERVYTYTVELIPTAPDGYSVHVPAVLGVVTEGRTVEEAVVMAREALELHLRGLRDDGLEIPIEQGTRRRSTLRVPIEVDLL